MFDLTREVKLSEKNEKRYRFFRFLVYAFSLIGAFYLAYIVLFPTAYFTFSFTNPDSTKNNVVRPRLNDGIFPDKGNVEGGQEVSFETALVGTYSTAEVEFVLSKKSEELSFGKVGMKKSYQSFFYPEGEKIDYQKNPDANGILSGDLVDYGGSAYVISENLIYPIDSIETFLMHGYSWSDLKKVSPDVISSYKKQKLFGLSSPHPDGTIFLTDSGKYYLIKDGKKFLISENFIGNLPQRNPIQVSEKSLEIEEFCELKKHPLWRRSYSCEMSLEKLKSLIGLDFQFRVDFENDVRLDYIKVRFKRKPGATSFSETFSNILRRVKENYVQ